jgi:hypothetical protein
MFTETPDFCSPATCTVDGYDLIATIEHDTDRTPWEDDGHGIVSEWTRRDKKPGEWVLIEERGARRHYDTQGTLRITKRDGWSAAPHDQGTRAERAARAVREDYERLRAWCRDEWCYVGVCVEVQKDGVTLTDRYASALWGIESDADDYLRDVANDLIADAIDQARKTLARICPCPPADFQPLSRG